MAFGSFLLNTATPAAAPVSAASGLMAAANPYLAGFQAVTSLLGGSRVKVSGANASGDSASGLSAFEGDNKNSIGAALVDFGSPVKVAIICAAVVGAIYLYKKGR